MEIKYSTIEKEALAIVWSVKYSRNYLLGRKFIIRSDHRPLKWLFSIKDADSKLLRWRLKLNEFDFDIEYTPGKLNNVADLLSRINIITWSQTKSIQHANVIPLISLSQAKGIIYFMLPDLSFNSWLTDLGLAHPVCKNEIHVAKFHGKTIFICCYRNSCREKFNRPDFSHVLEILKEVLVKMDITSIGIYDAINTLSPKHLPLIETVLTEKLNPKKLHWIYEGKVPSDKLKFFREIHESTEINHSGFEKCYNHIKNLGYHWPGLKTELKEFLTSYPTCQVQKTNRHPPSVPITITDTPKKPLDKLALDIVGLLPRTSNGNRLILTMQDMFSRFLYTQALETHTTEDICKTLLKLFAITGIPKRILTDQGPEFISNLTEEFFQRFQIQHIRCSVYHPQSNGHLERSHHTLK